MISSLSSSSNRISGLASGLDTETLVKQMTLATTNKIEAASQEKQLIEWKQEYYREITTKLNDFNKKHFGSSLHNLTIGDSLKQPKATSSASQYVTALPSANSSSQTLYVSDIQSLATSAKLTSSSPVSAALSTELDSSLFSSLGGSSMKFTLNGIEKTITFQEKEYLNAQDVTNELNAQLANAFGTDPALTEIDLPSSDKIYASLDGNRMILSSPSDPSSKINVSAAGIAGDEAIDFLGFENGASNRIKLNSTLSSVSLASSYGSGDITFEINGESFSFTAETTINTIISSINSSDAGVNLSFSDLTDAFVMTSKETGVGVNLSFKDTKGTFLNAILGAGNKTSGTDAVLKVGLNGATNEENLITITRSSNTFSIDGTTYTINGKASGVEKEDVTVTIKPDVDDLVTKITAFVDDYNELMEAINTKLNETRYKDFLPLTDDQKEALSETDQKLWTEKAKSGLLKNDMYLTSIVSALRSSMYASVKKLDGSGESLKYILPDIGISTGFYADNGKLTINETQLRKSLSEDPDSVISMLTQNASVTYSQYNTDENKEKRYEQAGLLWRLSDIVKNNLSKVGKKGSLIELVGSPDNNFLGITAYSKKISDIETTITNLNYKLTQEETRYYQQFTAMEKAMSNLNSQSSWISQQLSSK